MVINKYYPYTLSLRSPVILNNLGGNPNNSTTLSYIAGGVIRGVVASALGDPGSDGIRTAEFRALILSGDVCYLNAYPTVSQRRSLPAPVSLRRRKNSSESESVMVLDLAAFSGDVDDDVNGWPTDALEAFSYSFLTIGAAQLQGFSPEVGSRIHHWRDRSRGRAWVDSRGDREISRGGIFAYEYLESDQEFTGLLQIRGSSEEECATRFNGLQELLKEPILLGRSRKAGYGGDATISWGTPLNREVTGVSVIQAGLPQGAQFRVLLTSPCISRDSETGQVDPAAIITELLDRLDQSAKVIRKRWAIELVGGFNRKWRMEIPQSWSVAAGSVLVLEATQPIPFDKICCVEHEGLGERLVEGFGRCIFLTAPVKKLRVESSKRLDPAEPKSEPPELVHYIEHRILEDAARRQLAEQAVYIAASATRIPSASLLGRLRVPLRIPASGLSTLSEWLGNGSNALRHPACMQLEQCCFKFNGRSVTLMTWMQHLADTDDNRSQQELDDLLGFQILAQRFYVISEDTAGNRFEKMSENLAARLLDSVLENLARRKRKEASSND